MIAKRFFYVSAALLCLALAYHVGARSATAQVPSGVECTGFSDNGAAAVINHQLWLAKFDAASQVVNLGTIPSPHRAVACGLTGVVLENGETWRFLGDQVEGTWIYGGSFPFSGATPAQRESFGGMKSRYRGERGAAQPTQDR